MKNDNTPSIIAIPKSICQLPFTIAWLGIKYLITWKVAIANKIQLKALVMTLTPALALACSVDSASTKITTEPLYYICPPITIPCNKYHK